jgi:hypothetical protein
MFPAKPLLCSLSPNPALHPVVAELGCPFCQWGVAATAPSYLRAQNRVIDLLMQHLDAEHDLPARTLGASTSQDPITVEAPGRRVALRQVA